MRTVGNIIGLVITVAMLALITVLVVAAVRYQTPAQRYVSCVTAQVNAGHDPAAACGTSP